MKSRGIEVGNLFLYVQFRLGTHSQPNPASAGRVSIRSHFCNSLSIMAAKKRKSKRQTLQQKYKIIKRTKEHHRKLKKGVIVSSGSRKKVRDSIPNAWPYKEDLLKEIQAAKEKMEDNKLRQKEKRKEEVVSQDRLIYVELRSLPLFYLFIVQAQTCIQAVGS